MGKQNFITLQLLAISGILMSILVSMIAFHQFSLPDSKADLSTSVALVAPYVRVEKKEQTVVDGKKFVTVEIIANTSGMPVTGADIIVQYDPKVVAVTDEDIHSTGVLQVVNLNSNQEGVLDFSLFSEKSRNEPLLQTNADQEIEIATINMEVLDMSAALTLVELQFGENRIDESNLILFEDPRPETPTDILRTVQPGVISL